MSVGGGTINWSASAPRASSLMSVMAQRAMSDSFFMTVSIQSTVRQLADFGIRQYRYNTKHFEERFGARKQGIERAPRCTLWYRLICVSFMTMANMMTPSIQ